jgi:predicted RecB family nuclease
MKIEGVEIRLAATDVSNHLACHHLTTLELGATRGEWDRPQWEAPDLVVIRELGLRHERRYLEFLARSGLQVLNLGGMDERRIVGETLRAMKDGAEVIAQGALGVGRWFGRPDVLRKVAGSSRFGNWSYEAYDCKLARETKATTILQLAFYSELLAEVQHTTPVVPMVEVALGAASRLEDVQHSFLWDAEEAASTAALPAFMWVVPPGKEFAAECYRVAEYAAYYRYVKERLEAACANGVTAGTYPEPCAHCDVCRWFRECDRRRRGDDHLSLVAGIRRQQRDQLEEWATETVAKLAVLPIPLTHKPLHGSREGIVRVREQARVQVEGRARQKPVHEVLLPIIEGTGFCKLPEPSGGDVFVDLEGDPFIGECGQQYMFGFVATDEGEEQQAEDFEGKTRRAPRTPPCATGGGGGLRYERRWAFTAEEEKGGFEWFVDSAMARWKKFPAMHVYHFGAYEPGAFKNLMGKYATREQEIDSMLRAGLFVDLHTVFKQGLRASVEEYSLKKLEAFYGFERTTPLHESRAAMRYVEHRLELGWDDQELPEKFREAMEGYNGEDCFSTAALRDWLEGERKKLVDGGTIIARPKAEDGAATEELDARQKRVAELTARLTEEIPADAAARSPEQAAKWMLAQLLDWHRRENKATWWEGYRLKELDDAELLEDRAGLAGLRFVKRLGVERSIPTDRYGFEKQETEVRCDKDIYFRGEKFGCVVQMDLAGLTVDVKKTKKTAEFHPAAVYVWDRPVNVDGHADSLLRLGDWVHANGIDAAGQFRAARDLLLRRVPRLSHGETLAPLPGEEPRATACRIGSALDHSLLAIQGPPGAGKTFTGARMICQLVAAGKKVGVAALSHKVIRKLLEEVVAAAEEDKVRGVKCIQKLNDPEDIDPLEQITIVTSNEAPLAALACGDANVVGGTSWVWTRPEYFEKVDALFIDEAGQMALADVVAMGQAARNLVLIGDPQQLERPLKGSHPDGAEKSALEHLVAVHKTIPPEMGLLLPETWRMHPSICEFTSEMFYEGRLRSRDDLQYRVLAGHSWLKGAGLWFVPVQHSGNRNSSAEEVDVIDTIVRSLMATGVKWFRSPTNSKQMEIKDVLVVAPYNAQVSDLLLKLPTGAFVGTVDKFQGQEAPVVIYSLTTSTPEDAPRGMEFLYSLNRFNVATSRAMTAVVVVGNPTLFEPECKSPRQMQLANAFCAFLERATVVQL